MRSVLMITAAFACSGAHILIGALLLGEISTALVGQYVAAITFLGGVAIALAKVVQSLYQKMLDDKDQMIVSQKERISYLEKRLAAEDDTGK